MPLSNRIIKSMQTDSESSNEWVIDTSYELSDTVDYEEELNQEAAEELETAKVKSAQLLKNAETEKERLIEEARNEMAILKEDILNKAFEEGRKAGYEAGLTEGKQEGLMQIYKENGHILDEARKTVTEAQLDIEAYVEEKKDSLLSLSIHMAEKIVREQLDMLPDGILELVHPILHQLDRKEDYVSLTVHPSVRSFLREKLPSMEKNYPGVRFVLFQDETVDPLGCVVESAHKVIDLQVKNQLQAMVNEMKEREREM